MKKSKTYFEKNGGRSRKRLSKKEYRKIKRKELSDDDSAESIESTEYFDPTWLLTKPWHYRDDVTAKWIHRGVTITMHNFECPDCPNQPDHLIVRSGLDMDWLNLTPKNYQLLGEMMKTSDLEYLKNVKDRIDPSNKPANYDEPGYCDMRDNPERYISPENYSINGMRADEWVIEETQRLSDPETDFLEDDKWSQVIFCCHQCLKSTLSGSFCPGGRLNNHYVRKPETNQWVHFNDSLLFSHMNNREYIDTLSDLPVEFSLTHKNYRPVFRSRPNLLLEKRNFSFWNLPCKSNRKTGFCTLCEAVAGYNDSECLLYEEYEDGVCGHCNHDKEVHYFDPVWDQAWQTEHSI